MSEQRTDGVKGDTAPIQELFHHRERTKRRQAIPEVPILSIVESCSVASRPHIGFPAKHDRAVMCGTVDHDPLSLPLGQYAHRAARTSSALARKETLILRTDHGGPTRDKGAVLVLIENCLLKAKPIGQGNVTCILTSD